MVSKISRERSCHSERSEESAFKAHQGIILPTVIAILFILLILVITLGSTGSRNLSQVLHFKQAAAAYYAGQAGVARALYAVKTNDVNLPACGASGTPAYLSNQSIPDGGRFTATLTNNYNGSLGSGCSASLAAPDGTSVPQGFMYLSGFGTAGNITKPFRAMIQPSLQPSSVFPYSTFAIQTGGTRMTYSGTSYTDSYDSRQGAYGGSNVSRNGMIGTNSSSGNAVRLNNTANIRGRVDVVIGGTIHKAPGASYDSAAVLAARLSMPVVTDPLGGPGVSNITVSSGTTPLSPGVYHDVTVQNTGTLQLSCGAYSIRNFTVSNTALVTVSSACSSQEPARIFFHGAVQFTGAAGSSINATQPDTTLLMYGSSGAGNVQINEPATLALYSPNSIINVNASVDIYGSLVGGTLTVNNAAIHYDQALGVSGFTNSATVRALNAEY